MYLFIAISSPNREFPLLAGGHYTNPLLTKGKEAGETPNPFRVCTLSGLNPMTGIQSQ